MESTRRQIFFYLFRKGDDIEIARLTDVEAAQLWDQGKHWLDMPKSTLADAEALKVLLLANRS